MTTEPTDGAPPDVRAGKVPIERKSLAGDPGALGRLTRAESAKVATYLAGWGLLSLLRAGGPPFLLWIAFCVSPVVRIATAVPRHLRMTRGHRLWPDEPWRWDESWVREGKEVVVARARRGRSGLAWGVGLSAIAAYVAIEYGRGLWTFLTAGALASVGIWMAWQGFRDVRAGRLRLSFTQFPLFAGERIQLALGVSDGGARFAQATATLRCIEEFPGSVSPVCCTWWETLELAVDALPAPDHDALLAFEVPGARRGTDLHVRDACWWELEITGRTDAGAVSERFLVPLYEKPASVPVST